MIKPPASRRLRILAFDPSLAARIETVDINEIVLTLPWEELEPGPVGEYVEVIDYDPASSLFYEPVDLNHPHLLAQDGLAPSESDPQFHQQMVYAVAMTTIRHFERALGRVAFWADHRTRDAKGGYVQQFVRRLRIYPHALRTRNAYYSPDKKALLFGYFPVVAKDSQNSPGTVVYTALSHDIVAHEVTHALLDGVHRRWGESTHPDVYAFHEAFADVVALFQHFSYPSVLEHQIRRTRGDLQTQNLLGELAQQFGRATGRGEALRSALGGKNPVTGQWELRRPDPYALDKSYEPHDRGSVLVAAVFRAFLLIYQRRSADLFRIATQGTGVLPDGEIHPDLTRRLGREAAACAERVLTMCIRAIDYCPPVGITFGAFLRGVVTADLDFEPDDEDGFRTAFVQSFREWGIHPQGVISMGMDALAWPTGEEVMQELGWVSLAAPSNPKARQAEDDMVKEMQQDLKAELFGPAEGAPSLSSKPGAGLASEDLNVAWNLESDRFEVWRKLDTLRWRLWDWLIKEGDSGAHYGPRYARIFGLVTENQVWEEVGGERVSKAVPATVFRNKKGLPTVEVHAVRPSIRRTLYGGPRTDLVVEVTQRRRGYFDPDKQREMDASEEPLPPGEQGDFRYRAGATVVIDVATQEVRRVIRTPGTILDDNQLERERRHMTGEVETVGNAFDAGRARSLKAAGRRRKEPFALLHVSQEG